MAENTVDVTALALRAGSGLVSADQVIVFDQTGNTDRMPLLMLLRRLIVKTAAFAR